MIQRRCFWCDYVVDTDDPEVYSPEQGIGVVECELCRNWEQQLAADPAYEAWKQTLNKPERKGQ